MMATCLPGDILARAWSRQIGRLQPGAQADLLVINAKRGADPFSHVSSEPQRTMSTSSSSTGTAVTGSQS